MRNEMIDLIIVATSVCLVNVSNMQIEFLDVNVRRNAGQTDYQSNLVFSAWANGGAFKGEERISILSKLNYIFDSIEIVINIF